jgi:hypothetical protein
MEFHCSGRAWAWLVAKTSDPGIREALAEENLTRKERVGHGFRAYFLLTRPQAEKTVALLGELETLRVSSRLHPGSIGLDNVIFTNAIAAFRQRLGGMAATPGIDPSMQRMLGAVSLGRIDELRSQEQPLNFTGQERGAAVGHIFISYVREDSHRVDRLQQVLEGSGVRVWRDTADLWPGEDWRAKIRSAITGRALVFIACFSRASLARDRSYQNEEFTLAVEQLRLRPPETPWLIPVRFDECDIPDWDIGGGRTLTSIQRADLFDDSFKVGGDRLLTVILRILGRDPNTTATDTNTGGHLASQ